MPNEVRFIFFSRAEVEVAIGDHLRVRGIINAATPIRITEIAVKPLAVQAVEGTRAEQTRSLSHPELAAALIRYCIRNKIPLPARCQKGLEATGDGVVLGLARGVSDYQMRTMLQSLEPRRPPPQQRDPKAGEPATTTGPATDDGKDEAAETAANA